MIEISEPYKTILADELALVREKMSSESDIRKKTFYYSAAYAMVQRVFNLESKSNQQLIFMYVVLFMSYTKINERLSHIVVGDQLIMLSESFFDKIISYLQQLEEKIRNNEDTYSILEKIAVLTYTADGNGYYLYQKGSLLIPD